MQPTIMSLIEFPWLDDWNIMAIEFISSIIEGLNGSGQDWCISEIEFESILMKNLSSFYGFLNSWFRWKSTIGWKFDISPSCESILFVPDTFAVPQKDDLIFLSNWICTAAVNANDIGFLKIILIVYPIYINLLFMIKILNFCWSLLN